MGVGGGGTENGIIGDGDRWTGRSPVYSKHLIRDKLEGAGRLATFQPERQKGIAVIEGFSLCPLSCRLCSGE